jgi:DNA-binding MarR family transcriptional regulator
MGQIEILIALRENKGWMDCKSLIKVVDMNAGNMTQALRSLVKQKCVEVRRKEGSLRALEWRFIKE